ncbi:hydrolase [Trichophyton equinum CBS 127.97]|uniref:Hydrolase n=1 Tax=Trichophyton equinum (strain ATCC MYA-4606 / CBS 127.97) TaxID=559882 RepID=F2PQJ9_TRIEC|nr:hydrolase [Trichophyton equinum CBS 127.97]
MRTPFPRLSFSLSAATPTSIPPSLASFPDKTVSLRDGRVLGYAEYGCPSGYPLLYFHGWPSSRLEAFLTDSIAKRHGIRVISPDRPGFGISTFQPHRRIIDWSNDIQDLARHLEISRFAILGGSGGGPYAVACAHALPHESLSAVGVLAGAGPWIAGTQDVPLVSRMMGVAANNIPWAFIGMTNMLVGSLRWMLSTNHATRWLDNWIESTKKEDDKTPTQEGREALLRIAFEGFAQGSRGFVHEAQLLSQDWGFRFEDVKYNKIRIWHGTQDTNSPIRLTRYMAEKLPHSELQEWDDTHYTIGERLEEVITKLLPKEIRRPASS